MISIISLDVRDNEHYIHHSFELVECKSAVSRYVLYMYLLPTGPSLMLGHHSNSRNEDNSEKKGNRYFTDHGRNCHIINLKAPV